VFYNPQNDIIYPNQWDFLQTIEKTSSDQLDTLYDSLFVSKDNATIFDIQWTENSSSNITKVRTLSNQPIHIVLSWAIFLRLSELPSHLIAFIKQELNIFNTEYAIKKKLGKSVYKTERYFHLLEESGDTVIMPHGFLPALLSFLDSNSLAYKMIEKYELREPTKYISFIQFRQYQKDLMQKISDKQNGIIIAPPGSGKTVIALDLIAGKHTKTLILVNRRELLSQWVERIEQFLWIPKSQIGIISGTKKKVGEKITVATFQSLVRFPELSSLQNEFEMIIVDECHHISAESYRKIVLKFSTKYCFGLTATHERQFGKEKIAELMIGGVIGELESHENVVEQSFEIRCIQTDIFLPFRYSTSHYETLAKTICYDTGRNQLIVKEVMLEVKNGRKVLLLTERKEHIEILLLYLKTQCECITLSGDDAKSARDMKMKQIRDGHYSVIIATGQFLWEGIDVPGIESLILAFPFGFKGKLIQYIGRMRWSGMKVIVDFCDKKIPFLMKQWKSREKYYREKCSFWE
jgi:superfamily II DNA or RNA helicase